MEPREIMARANYETIGDDFATALADKRIKAPDWSEIGDEGQSGWLKASDAEIQALTEASYTIEQWIEFDEPPTIQKYRVELTTGEVVEATADLRNFTFDRPVLLQEVQRYKAIG